MFTYNMISECICGSDVVVVVNNAHWIFNLVKFNFRIYLIDGIAKRFKEKKVKVVVKKMNTNK